MLLRSLLFRWQLCAGARMRGCAQAAVKATLEVAAHNGPRFPHFPQALLRKKFLEIFWGYRLSSVSSKEKSVRRYLKSPPDLPKVPTPGGRCRTLYLKSPPDLPKVPTHSFVGKSVKNLRRYLKSPPDLPKVPTPGGRCRTLYLKSPPWRIFEGRVIHRCAGWGLASGSVDR